jgi:hypothetical protein
MRFEGPELKPYGELVSASSLRVGDVSLSNSPIEMDSFRSTKRTRLVAAEMASGASCNDPATQVKGPLS